MSIKESKITTLDVSTDTLKIYPAKETSTIQSNILVLWNLIIYKGIRKEKYCMFLYNIVV